MSIVEDDDFSGNEYLDLPDDPEVAFAILHRRKYNDLEAEWENNTSGNGWYCERRYCDFLLAFDEVHDLGILTEFRTPPRDNNDFSNYFQNFRRHTEVTSQKILIEAARRVKTGAQQVVVLDTAARTKIHALIASIRERLNELTLPENKRDSLFSKLNAFASEVDRNRTRTESFYNFAIDAARVGREVAEEIKPMQETIDRVFDWLDKATKWRDALPPWADRKRIEGPRKQLPPPESNFDDEIPF